MLSTLFVTLAGIITFAILDYTWLALLMKKFYLKELSAHIKIVDGSLVPFLPAVPFVYIICIVLILVYVLPAGGTWQIIFQKGFMLGLLAYAFYNLTNLAVLKEYSFPITILDSLWGGLIFGIVSVVMFIASRIIS